ncbi:MAG: hypothetical protein OEY38_23470 [Gammaproteobacteria bacterium]|nr:hypothetical protein [Gammaproteobacteria bacterium]
MQFLESSVIGLRAAIYQFSSSEHNLEFVVFPMVHIGDPLYYQQILKQLGACDNVIFEGVKSKKIWFLTQSYKIVAKRKSLGLVTQNSALRLKELPLNLIHGDVSEDKFNKAWSEIPLYFRILVSLLAPLYGVYKYLSASRESLAQGHTLDDLNTMEDLSDTDAEIALNKVILDDRDRELIATIEKHVKLHRNKQEKTAIIYGAKHMPAVVTVLTTKFGYRVTNSEWVSAI